MAVVLHSSKLHKSSLPRLIYNILPLKTLPSAALYCPYILIRQHDNLANFKHFSIRFLPPLIYSH